MPNPKIETLVDAFTASAINTALWNNVTGGAATLDTVNDEIVLAMPTASGATNTFGSNSLYDATGSSVYACVGVSANGNGTTRTAIRIRFDATNAVTMRVESGVFKLTSQTGTSTILTLPTYDPNAHRWWRLRESGGSFFAGVSPDGITWTELGSLTYGFDATNITFRLESATTGTEVAGNASTISHVNTRLGGQFNGNWPLIEDSWGPYWTRQVGDSPLDRYVEITDRTHGAVSVNRGRQYELDQIRSGEASMTLTNTDEALDPTNASGPWAGTIQPYQPYRRRAQWPATRNLLDQVMATGGDVGGYSPGPIPQGSGGADIFSTTDGTGGAFVSTASAWRGSLVMQFSVPSGAASGAMPCYTPRWPALPGKTYTVTLQVRDVTASTSLSVQALLGWHTAGVSLPTSYTYGTATVLTGSTTAGWTTITVTGTAPANVVAMSCGVALAATAAATASLQVDGWQLEKGAVASAWACPGIWYPVYAGFMERWPLSWDLSGTYGLVTPTAVDAFSLLSQTTLTDPLTEEISSHNPRFVYRLDDPDTSMTASDWTGNNPGAPIAISKYGAGSLTFGNAVTATDATGTYTGSPGTVATLNNSNPGTSLTSGGASFISLSSAGITGPSNPAVWTRMIAFRYTGPMPTSAACMWSSMDRQSGGVGSHVYAYLGTDGHPVVSIHGPTGSGIAFGAAGATNCADGDWHLLMFGYNQATQQLMISQDGATAAFFGSIPTTCTPTGMVADSLGGFVDVTVGGGTTWNWKGDISFAAEFPVLIDSTGIANMYAAWKSACAGESTNARYARILRYSGYIGPSVIQTGLTTSMGPANIDGQDAMSALQQVVDSENGEHFIDRRGFVQFKGRGARYNSFTPMFTFGEKPELGEWPYEDCQLDYDSTHISNQVTVTQAGTSQNFYAQDAASIADYFPRSLSRTINSSSAGECQDAASYLLSRYRQPATRVASIKLHPSGQPGMWPVCLSLELGTRVRIMRRPPGVPAIQVECFIENVGWEFDTDGEAWVTLQCSPADLTPYGILAAFHCTLNGSPAAGVSTITINAGSDNTNPAAAQLGYGQQLVLGQGTANQETVTVLAVQTTSPGWTTATLTLQAATTKAHSNGDVVCEPLPSGVNDPTMYDANAMFDSISFSY